MMVTNRRLVVLVCLGFVTLSTLVAFKTPPWEANDEPDHARNVESLRSGHWYRITQKSGLESEQPPLYYLGLAGYAETIRLRHNPTTPVNQRGPAAFRRRGLFRHDVSQDATDSSYVRALRIPNILLGLLSVLLTYAVARRVTRDRWTPLLAAAICAFIPKFVFLSGVINNDNLANTLGAVATLAAVHVAVHRPSRPVLWAAGLGALLGLLTITKLSAVPLGIGLLASVAYLAAKDPERRIARLVSLVSTFVVSALLVSGWWLIRNAFWYGDPVASKAEHDHVAHVAPVLVSDVGFSVHRALVTVPSALWHSFWYESGWNQFLWGTWLYLPFWILFTIGMLALVWPRRSLAGNAPQRRALVVLVALALGGFASFWILNFQVNGIEGRLVFVALAAISTLLALGFERLPIPVWLRFALPTLGLAAIIVAIYQDVLRFYA